MSKIENHEEKIRRIKCRLLVQEPFFGHLLSGLTILPHDNISKFQIYGNEIYYNIKYVESLDNQKLANQLLHCLMHIVFCHFVRKKSRTAGIWAMSTDIAVNNILSLENNKQIDGVTDQKFKGKAAENIYEVLKLDENNATYGTGSRHNVFDEHIDVNDRTMEEETLKNIVESHAMAKMAGKLPGGLESFFKDLLDPQLSWKEILRKYATECFLNEDYSFTNPRKCLLAFDIYCASLFKEEDTLKELWVAVDTSGSISDQNLKEFMTEISSLHYLSETTKVVTCDAVVHSVFTLNIFDKIKTFKFKGRGGCYDEQTELLTKEGWKFFKDVRENEIVATLNPKTNLLEYQKIEGITNKPYNGNMIKILSNTFGCGRVDLLVTPEHNMFIKDQQSWKRIAADSLPNTFKLKRIANWKGKKEKYFTIPAFTRIWKRSMDSKNRERFHNSIKIKMNDWLEFFGLYIAEGSIRQNKAIEIPQIKRVKEVRKILNKLPFKYTMRWSKGVQVFTIFSVPLAMYLKQFGKCNQKFVPDFIKDLSSEQIKLFMNGYTIGDGHINKNNSREWSTVSKKLADDILELLLKTGSSGSIHYLDRGGNRQRIYRISEYKKKSFRIRKDKYVSEENYNGRIYCVTVPNHILYVRRNGIPVWCGNTDFRPVFNYISNHKIQPTLLIYLTDLCGPFPDKAPTYPVIWVNTYNKTDKAPFGETIYMGEKNG